MVLMVFIHFAVVGSSLAGHNASSLPDLLFCTKYDGGVSWFNPATKHHGAAPCSPFPVGWGGGLGKKKVKLVG